MSEFPAVNQIMMVGVVPPPFHGQGIATKALFDADLSPIEKVIVEIRSSTKLSEVGKVSLGKILGILKVVGLTVKRWLIHRPRVLYYTAGSGSWVPFARDIFVLGICRPLFQQTLIHYHSGDLVNFLNASSFREKIGRFIYGRGAWSIRLGENCSAPDFGSETRLIDVPNGLDAPSDLPLRVESDRFRVIFLGNLFESKGVLDLLSAVKILSERNNHPLTIKLVGGYSDPATETAVRTAIQQLPSHVFVPPPAPAYDGEKWVALMDSDVLVFPSWYSCENLPLVIIEAMAAGLPVIGSNWRGIPTLVQDGENGIIVPVSDPQAIADALERLIANPDLTRQMGQNSVSRYQRHFTMKCHLDRMKQILTEALTSTQENR